MQREISEHARWVSSLAFSLSLSLYARNGFSNFTTNDLEGYEDRDRFVILQKVGLDEKQTKRTIRKQIFDCVLLTFAFAFCASGFAYHMLEPYVESAVS